MTSAPTFALLCPVCGGQVEQTSERSDRRLFACKECRCDFGVPASAWEVARIKREQKWQIKRTAFSPLRRLFGSAEGASVASGPGTRLK
jgi:hypothetical protein